MNSRIDKNSNRSSIGKFDNEPTVNLEAVKGSNSEFYRCLEKKRGLWIRQTNDINKIQVGNLHGEKRTI